MQPDRHEISVSVNGTPYRRSVESRMLLSDFLRHDLLLAGTHVGCEHGVCGACTILLDGAPIRSCLMLAVQANGHELSTIEGLASEASERLIAELRTYMVQPGADYTHKWRKGDIVIWDNRCSYHKAAGDYPPEEDRIHWRVSIKEAA